MAEEKVLKATFTVNDSLELTLDFTGEAEKYLLQFGEYIKMYDINNTSTVLNLKTWAAARKIPCTIKFLKTFHWWSLVTRIIMALIPFVESRGQNVVQPQPWKKSE